jgi:hypothetical protein
MRIVPLLFTSPPFGTAFAVLATDFVTLPPIWQLWDRVRLNVRVRAIGVRARVRVKLD